MAEFWHEVADRRWTEDLLNARLAFHVTGTGHVSEVAKMQGDPLAVQMWLVLYEQTRGTYLAELDATEADPDQSKYLALAEAIEFAGTFGVQTEQWTRRATAWHNDRVELDRFSQRQATLDTLCEVDLQCVKLERGAA